MYKQKKAYSDMKQQQQQSDSEMSKEAIAYLNSLKEATKAMHSVKSETEKREPEKSGTAAGRKASTPVFTKKNTTAYDDRKGSQLGLKPQRRASISSVVSDIWERKGKLSKDSTLSEMNIREADELSDALSDLTISDLSDAKERSNNQKENATVAPSGSGSGDKNSKSLQHQRYSNTLSLTPHAKDAQKSGKKKKPAEEAVVTVDELASGHPAPGTIGRKSTSGVADSREIRKSIEKSIFGTSTRTNASIRKEAIRQSISSQSNAQPALIATKDSEPFQIFDNDNTAKHAGTQKQSPFKKVKTVASGSSSPSAISSVASVVEELPAQTAEKAHNVFDYNIDSFEETTSVETLSTTSSKTARSSLKNVKIGHKKVESKLPVDSDNRIDKRKNDSHSSSRNRITAKRPAETTLMSKINQISDSEDLTASSSGTETSDSSVTIATQSRDKTKKTEQRRNSGRNNYKYEYSENVRGRRKRTNSERNLPSELSETSKVHIRRHETRTSSYGTDSRNSSQDLEFWPERSRRDDEMSGASMGSFTTSSEVRKRNSRKQERSSGSRHSELRYTNLLADFEKLLQKFADDSRKVKLHEKGLRSNVAVQTAILESEKNFSPTFTPLLLRDIEENMKTMDEREAVSSIIQTHVQLIKNQALREKRALEEWNSAISDLEERCPVVTFDRLKLILHGPDYFNTF